MHTNYDNLKELQALLWEQGLRAEVCDTPVPVSLAGVPCGIPTELGDECIDDYILLPKKLVGQYPEMFVPAIGDSMANAGYEPGDRLRIRFGMQAHDSCDVLAMIDGACTVKTLFTDEEGTTWLVPQNEKYDAIRLKDEMDVRILGVVVGVERPAYAPLRVSCCKASVARKTSNVAPPDSATRRWTGSSSGWATR